MTQLLQNAVYGTVLILAVAVLRGTLRARLHPEARLVLWAVCLFRLFTPIAPTSALSLWRLFGRAWELTESVPAAPVAPALVIPTAPTAPSMPAAPAAPAEAGVSWGALLAAVWIAVALILAARYVLAYAHTSWAVERAVPLGREDARYAALPKCVRLREGTMEGAPLTFGVVRPTVVLPFGLDGVELACVLAHEGVHARRRDNLWHYAAAVALTVFWWNPAVWLMARLIRRDVELSCDRAAVCRLGADRRTEYANALITLSTQAEGGAFCHGFGPKRTEERIIAIMKYKKTTITGIALTLALVLAVTVGFASNPMAETPDEEGTTSSAIPEGENITSPVYDDMGSGGLFVDSIQVELPEFVSYDDSDSDAVLEEYKALLERAVAQGKRSRAEAEEMLANMEALIERARNGEIEGLMFNRQASGEVSFVEQLDEPHICTREDCTISAEHFHELGEVIYLYNTLPAYVEVCPVEGCTALGTHIHDGHDRTIYLCNGAGHEGGVCDGSCYVYFDDGELPLAESQGFTHDPQGPADHAGDNGKPIGCPPEAIDKDFYQNYPEANYQDFEHPESGSSHHQDGHHSDSHH